MTGAAVGMDFSIQSFNANNGAARVSDEDEAASGAEGASTGSSGVSRRAGIISRLYAALDHKMREIEHRIERASQAGGEGLSAADSERDARTLTALARLFEKLSDLDTSSAAQAVPKGEAPAGKEIDADRFRLKIADRLERMLKAEPD